MKRWIAASHLRALLTVIGVITVLSGAAQVLAPAVVLRPLGAEVTPTTRQLFATVGMFMVVVGGLLTHTLLSDESTAITVLWSALQKLGAALAVFIGVAGGVFAVIALCVAAFDLSTAVLLGVYWRRVGRGAVLRPVPGAVAR